MSTHDPEASQNPTPDLQAITAAYGDILEHNRTHTGFGAMFKGMLSGLAKDAEVIDPDNADPVVFQSAEDVYKGVAEKLEEGVVEGDMNAELQDIFHGDTFLRAGIKIAPFGSFGANGEGTAVTSAELVPMIENTSLFAEFLGKLKPEDIQNEAAKTLLSDVVTNLSRVTGICFDAEGQKGLSDEEKAQLVEAGEDALRTFVTIDPEYERLGIDGSALRKRTEDISEELLAYIGSGVGGFVPAELSDEYTRLKANQAKMRVYEGMSSRVQYWGRNLLPEYIEAQSGQYLTPPAEQGFGPSGWQKDGGQRHWQQAFDFLQRLEQDERTKPFADEVRQGLISSVDFALAELDDPNKDIYWRGQGNDLENIRSALSGGQFDEAKLAAYIKKPDSMS